jgi:hypothetical protein
VGDRIVEKLRMPAAAVASGVYRLLTPAHLRTLAEITPTIAPVLSFYLQLTARADGSAAPLVRGRKMLRN